MLFASVIQIIVNECSQHLQIAVECKMPMDIEEYATSFRPDIIDAVSGWCQGANFAKILTLTDVFEVRIGHTQERKLLLFAKNAGIIGKC